MSAIVSFVLGSCFGFTAAAVLAAGKDGGPWTCKMDAFADARFVEEGDDDSNYEWATLAECSECRAVVLIPPALVHYDGHTDSLYASTNFCPSCGARVEVV